MSRTRNSGVPDFWEPPVPPRSPVSFEEYLAWGLREEAHAEWVDGEIIVTPPESIEHQFVLGFIYQLVAAFVEVHQLGEVLFAGFVMRLRIRPSGREPDLLFVATEHADRLRDTYLDGPADLVVEIVSPESEQRDRVDKLAEYALAGIPEYWLVDLIRREAIFYRLDDDGRYRRGPIDADGFYHSSVLSGFRLRVEWLWQRPLPAIAEVAPLTET